MLCYSGQGRPTVWEAMATEEIACDTHRERGCHAMQGHTGKHQCWSVGRRSDGERGKGGHELQVPAERNRQGRLNTDKRELFQITAMGCRHKSCSGCLVPGSGGSGQENSSLECESPIGDVARCVGSESAGLLRKGSLSSQVPRSWLDLQDQQASWDIQLPAAQKIKRQDGYTDAEAKHVGQRGQIGGPALHQVDTWWVFFSFTAQMHWARICPEPKVCEWRPCSFDLSRGFSALPLPPLCPPHITPHPSPSTSHSPSLLNPGQMSHWVGIWVSEPFSSGVCNSFQKYNWILKRFV